MSTRTKKSRSPSAERKRRKTRHIVRGMAATLLQRLVACVRVWLDAFIDFVFGLYWDSKKQVVPDLDKKHAFLAESATELARRVRQRELTSEQLVSACIERIQAVNPIINAVTDERYAKALDEARAVDRLVEKGLSEDDIKNKPFLGVPFTVKESIAAEGLLHTWGLLSRSHLRAHADAECVARLKRAGCILIAVSNVPEVNKWQETRNYLFGQTNNPYHSGRTVGGSSGGEGALVASLASPIGLCSDIGGSTRMPSFYNGLFCLNSTSGSTNLRGVTNRTGLECDSMVSVGVATKHPCDLGPLTAILAGEKAAMLNLDRAVTLKDVKVYYTIGSKDLRCSSVSSDLKQAMKRAVGELSSTSCGEPVAYQHEGLGYMYSLWRYWMTQEGESFQHMLTNNTGSANGIVELVKKVFGMSNYTLAAIIKLLDDQVMPKVDEQWARALTAQLRNDLIEKLGESGVLLFPSCSQPAPYHYTAYLRPFNFSYWGIFNALKFPSVQVPLGLNAEGVPLGLQVVSSPYNEAVCLEVAKHLEKTLGGFVAPCKVPK